MGKMKQWTIHMKAKIYFIKTSYKFHIHEHICVKISVNI